MPHSRAARSSWLSGPRSISQVLALPIAASTAGFCSSAANRRNPPTASTVQVAYDFFHRRAPYGLPFPVPVVLLSFQQILDHRRGRLVGRPGSQGQAHRP